MALKLGINEPYRSSIEMAQQLTGIDGSSIAAMIDAEAAKIQSGPKKGMWDKDSKNNTSGASGLTQFLEGTWIDHGQRTTHLLNTRGKDLGLINSQNKVIASKRAEFLKLRFDPLLSIVSAAEYGVDNLKILANDGALPGNLTDDLRARYMYLAHHEGASGAKGFLKGTKVYTRANLVGQVGADTADRLIDRAGGDANKAYRAWLNGYMDEKIVPSKFRDNAPSPTAAVAPLVNPIPGASISLASLPAGDILPAGKAIVTTEGLRLRKTPDGEIIRDLTLGETVMVIQRIGDTRWYDVDVGGTKGVVSGSYLRRPLSTAREALFRRTVDEWVRFNKGRSSEEDEPYDTYVHDMWLAIDLDYWGHSVYPETGKDVPWSAAFISWCVRKAHAKYASFAFAAGHAKFANDAIRARVTEQLGRPFWGYRITEQRPELGDIILRNRSGNSFSYEYAENHERYESHSDIVVEVRGRIVRVIGGNTGSGQGTVAVNEYTLDENGYLEPNQRVIAVLKNRVEEVP